jgi:hypothetical protein
MPKNNIPETKMNSDNLPNSMTNSHSSSTEVPSAVSPEESVVSQVGMDKSHSFSLDTDDPVVQKALVEVIRTFARRGREIRKERGQ